MIYRAVAKTADDPIPYEDRLQFPIIPTDGEFKKKAYLIKPLPDKLRSWLERVQPYKTEELLRDEPGSVDTSISGLLNILHNGARKDRHRHLHSVGALGSELNGSVDFNLPVEVGSWDGVACNFLEDEGEIVRLKLKHFVAGLTINLKSELHLKIAVEEIPDVAGPELMQTLLSLEEIVRLVIYKFEQHINV